MEVYQAPSQVASKVQYKPVKPQLQSFELRYVKTCCNLLDCSVDLSSRITLSSTMMSGHKNCLAKRARLGSRGALRRWAFLAVSAPPSLPVPRAGCGSGWNFSKLREPSPQPGGSHSLSCLNFFRLRLPSRRRKDRFWS